MCGVWSVCAKQHLAGFVQPVEREDNRTNKMVKGFFKSVEGVLQLSPGVTVIGRENCDINIEVIFLYKF